MNYFSIGIHKKNVDLTAFFISNVFSELEKGANKDLNKAIKQSDGTYLTPFQQAKHIQPTSPTLDVLDGLLLVISKNSISMTRSSIQTPF